MKVVSFSFHIILLRILSYQTAKVLQGLNYIHETLQISHGSVNTDNIKMSKTDEIKLYTTIPSLEQRLMIDIEQSILS